MFFLTKKKKLSHGILSAKDFVRTFIQVIGFVRKSFYCCLPKKFLSMIKKYLSEDIFIQIYRRARGLKILGKEGVV